MIKKLYLVFFLVFLSNVSIYANKINISEEYSTNLKFPPFDIKSIILNSADLDQVFREVNFYFEQDGSKVTSTDGQYISVRYKNGSDIYPLISYYKNGDIKQIIFMMPISDMEYIGKELIQKYGITNIKGIDVVKKGNLTYEFASDDPVGIIIVY